MHPAQSHPSGLIVLAGGALGTDSVVPNVSGTCHVVTSQYLVGFVDYIVHVKAVHGLVWAPVVVCAGYLPVQPHVAVAPVVPQAAPALTSRDLGAQAGRSVHARARARHAGHAAFVLDAHGAVVARIVRVAPTAVALAHVLVYLAVAADAVVGRSASGALENAVGAGQIADHDVQGDMAYGVAVAPVVVVRAAHPFDVAHTLVSFHFCWSVVVEQVGRRFWRRRA